MFEKGKLIGQELGRSFSSSIKTAINFILTFDGIPSFLK